MQAPGRCQRPSVLAFTIGGDWCCEGSTRKSADLTALILPCCERRLKLTPSRCAGVEIPYWTSAYTGRNKPAVLVSPADHPMLLGDLGREVQIRR